MIPFARQRRTVFARPRAAALPTRPGDAPSAAGLGAPASATGPGALASIAMLTVAALLGSPAPTAAQAADTAEAEPRAAPVDSASAELVGRVVSSSTGQGVDGAVVTLVSSGYGAITDSTGAFRIPQATAGQDTVEVRYIGYEPSRTPVRLAPDATTRAVFLLSPTVVRVAELNVEVRRSGMAAKLRGFEERRERGFGVFIGPEEIRDRNPRLPSDLLRQVPGVSVGRVEHGRAPVSMGRGARRCPPAVYLDGVYLPGMLVDDIPPEDLGAMEVYRSANETPVEYMRTRSECGVILIWTPVGNYQP